jgi:hypothetical protein
MQRERIAPISLGLITLFMAPAAVQATFTPRSFFDDFPLGRHWISGTGDLDSGSLHRWPLSRCWRPSPSGPDVLSGPKLTLQ